MASAARAAEDAPASPPFTLEDMMQATPIFHRPKAGPARAARARMSWKVAAIAVTFACATQAEAQSTISEASALSALPIAVSVAAPVAVLSAGAALTLVTIEATSSGAVWVLERGSDGARASVRLVGRGLAGASLAAGTAIVCTALSTGWVLSAAGEAIAFVPNELGRALLYNERITR
jgi:hypothetical protein